jgi:hypothetical protein
MTDNPNGGVLDGYHVAYESWGELNAEKDNTILLFTGLSVRGASDNCKHARPILVVFGSLALFFPPFFRYVRSFSFLVRSLPLSSLPLS